MYVIGFATTFYTLWDVNTYEKWGRDRQGQPYSYMETSHQYLRNLSLSLDAAEEKLRAAIGDEAYRVDLDLRGKSYFVITGEKREAKPEEMYTFTFGKLKGQDIRTAGHWITENRIKYDERAKQDPLCDLAEYTAVQDSQDAQSWKEIAWQLDRAMKQESTPRRKACARRKLIELGELVRRDWKERYILASSSDNADEPVQYGERKRKWMPKGLAKWHDEIGSKKGLFYEDGKRIELTLFERKRKMVKTDYGVMYIINYTDQNGNIVTYKGGTPLMPDTTKYGKAILILATIKHKNNETFFQRGKLITVI